MKPSIDLMWCHAGAVTFLAFYKSIDLHVVFVALGHYVTNIIMVCFPTLFLASFLDFTYLSQSFFFPVRLAFLYALFFLLAIIRMTLSDHGWLILVEVIFDGACLLMIWSHVCLKLVHKLSAGVEVLFSARIL